MLPLNCTVTLLSPDAVGVVQRFQELAVAVALDIPRDSSEVLSTVCRGPGNTPLLHLISHNIHHTYKSQCRRSAWPEC